MPPRAGREVGAIPAGGTVRIKKPGGRFRVMREADILPNGTTVDTLKGRITLIAPANRSGQETKADFYDGIFKIRPVQGPPAHHHAHADREAHVPEGR